MSDKKILVVDDEASIRLLLRSAIAAPGVTVYEAEDGKHALAIAQEHAPFELVVTDVMMPEMDGIELARQLKDGGQADRFLFVSGFCDLDAAPERIREFGSAAFLAKPFSITELLHRVHDLLESQQRPSQTRQQSSRSA